MDEDEIMMWQDVLDDVAAGRVQSLRCPFCKGGVAIEQNEQRTRLECRSCHRFIEGKMATS
jgi:hypothetical protein